MGYSLPNQYKPWRIFVYGQNLKIHPIAQYRNSQDAEKHLQWIKRAMPSYHFALAFVPPEFDRTAKKSGSVNPQDIN